MFGLLYLPLFLVILPLMCYWAGRLIGRGMVRVLPEWSWRLVNYPVWKRNLIGSMICLALFMFMVGDEMYAKYRIETLCKQAGKELPRLDKDKLSNRDFFRVSHRDLTEQKIFVQIIGSSWIYIDIKTEQKVAEYKKYMFQNGWLVRLYEKILPSNTALISIAYISRKNECTTEIPDLKAWNSKLIYK